MLTQGCFFTLFFLDIKRDLLNFVAFVRVSTTYDAANVKISWVDCFHSSLVFLRLLLSLDSLKYFWDQPGIVKENIGTLMIFSNQSPFPVGKKSSLLFAEDHFFLKSDLKYLSEWLRELLSASGHLVISVTLFIINWSFSSIDMLGDSLMNSYNASLVNSPPYAENENQNSCNMPVKISFLSLKLNCCKTGHLNIVKTNLSSE